MSDASNAWTNEREIEVRRLAAGVYVSCPHGDYCPERQCHIAPYKGALRAALAEISRLRAAKKPR